MNTKKTIFIAHPINGDIEGNMKKVLDICAHLHNEDTIPVAPYLISLQYLDDSIPKDRDLGIIANLETLNRGYVDELWVYGDSITPGMKQEVTLALSLGIPVFPQTEGTKRDFEMM